MLLLLFAASLKASSSSYNSDNESDLVSLTIRTHYRIPDVTATVGKLFLLQIPPDAYSQNVNTIKVIIFFTKI